MLWRRTLTGALIRVALGLATLGLTLLELTSIPSAITPCERRCMAAAPAPGPPAPSTPPAAPTEPAPSAQPAPPTEPAPPAAEADAVPITVLLRGTPIQLKTLPRLQDSAVVVDVVELLGPLGLTARWCQWAAGVEIREVVGQSRPDTAPEASTPRYAVLFDRRPYALVGGMLVDCVPACAAEDDSFFAPLDLLCAAFEIAFEYDPGTHTVILAGGPGSEAASPPTPASGPAKPPGVRRRPLARHSDAREAYLTIDDGPDPVVTPKMLEVLRQYGVKATFFVIGWRAEAFPKIVRRIAAEGHSLGNHTYSHKYSEIYSSPDAYISSLRATSQVLQRVVGVRGMVSRPPGGSWGHLTGEYEKAIREAGYTTYDWNVTAADTAEPPPSLDEIAGTVWNQLDARKRSGARAIILMHDGHGHETTAEALPAIIRVVASMGYKFGTIGEHATPAIPSTPAPATPPALEEHEPPAAPPAPEEPAQPPAPPPADEVAPDASLCTRCPSTVLPI